MASSVDRRICLAPMMGYTDRHFRYLMRLISKNVMLYTEMVHCGAILCGDRHRILDFHPSEMPVALQIGGNHPQYLARCAQIAEDYGYCEVNLNIGCPSDRVQSGQFGACLMADPERVAECVAAMKAVVSIPVTVKNRTGIDNYDNYDFLIRFIHEVSSAGCKTFIIHARKAWLNGLNPKQNREIPMLEYQKVYNIKNDFPELEIIINGGIEKYHQADLHMSNVDGVMIGRRAYEDTYYWREIDSRYFGFESCNISREMIVRQYCEYIQFQLERKVQLRCMVRHLLNMFHGQPGVRKWRRYMSEKIHQPFAGVEVVEQALALINLKLVA